MRWNWGLGITAAVVMMGCAGESQEPVAAQPAELGQVTVTAMQDTLVTGTYLDQGELLRFEAKKIADKLFSVTMVLHGLTLEATTDHANGVQSLDGYSTADGVDTQMAADDITMVLRFVKAIEKQYPQVATTAGAPKTLSEIANVWAEWIPSMPLKFTKVFAQDRQTSWCSRIGTYQYTTHDCWSCSNGGGCTSNGYVGAGGSCGDDWWLWNGSSWYTCADQNHNGGQYGNGNCFARCGAGCGSGTTYSYECARHDECVRNGHVTSSSWCSDELSSACWTDCSPCGRN